MISNSWYAFKADWYQDAYSDFGRRQLWLLPVIEIAIIVIALMLRKSGKLLAASIFLWIPGIPLLVGIVLWGGLAAIFILFGK